MQTVSPAPRVWVSWAQTAGGMSTSRTRSTAAAVGVPRDGQARAAERTDAWGHQWDSGRVPKSCEESWCFHRRHDTAKEKFLLVSVIKTLPLLHRLVYNLHSAVIFMQKNKTKQNTVSRTGDSMYVRVYTHRFCTWLCVRPPCTHVRFIYNCHGRVHHLLP